MCVRSAAWLAGGAALNPRPGPAFTQRRPGASAQLCVERASGRRLVGAAGRPTARSEQPLEQPCGRTPGRLGSVWRAAWSWPPGAGRNSADNAGLHRAGPPGAGRNSADNARLHEAGPPSALGAIQPAAPGRGGTCQHDTSTTSRVGDGRLPPKLSRASVEMHPDRAGRLMVPGPVRHRRTVVARPGEGGTLGDEQPGRSERRVGPEANEHHGDGPARASTPDSATAMAPHARTNGRPTAAGTCMTKGPVRR
jgi:hypothetical protein